MRQVRVGIIIGNPVDLHLFIRTFAEFALLDHVPELKSDFELHVLTEIQLEEGSECRRAVDLLKGLPAPKPSIVWHTGDTTSQRALKDLPLERADFVLVLSHQV